MRAPSLPESIARLAATPAGGLLRRAANLVVGRRQRVVRVRAGIARGALLELDLRREKAYWLGHYELPVQEFLEANVKPGDVVYDVGAHIGFFSVGAARLGAKVFAFEPSPANAERLRRNVLLNALDVEVVEAAVWSDERGVELVAGAFPGELRTREGGTSPSLTLDSFVACHPPPTLLKVDAEGAEARVLGGAARLLRERPPVVICELHGEDSCAAVRQLLPDHLLSPLGGDWRVVARPRSAVG